MFKDDNIYYADNLMNQTNDITKLFTDVGLYFICKCGNKIRFYYPRDIQMIWDAKIGDIICECGECHHNLIKDKQIMVTNYNSCDGKPFPIWEPMYGELAERWVDDK